MAGPWQHFLPAAYLAGFATVRAQPPRKALLWVARRGLRRVWQTKAERIGAANGLYSLSAPMSDQFGPDFLDEFWTRFEPGLLRAMDVLLSDDTPRVEGIDGETWVNALVPFAAQRFVRGVEYARIVQNRAITTNRPPPNPTDIVHTRVKDYFWLAGAVARAEWTILHVPKGKRIVVNDIGRVPLSDQGGSRANGWGIPLRHDAVLMLLAGGPNGAQLWVGSADSWIAGPIRHVQMDDAAVASFNEASARFAHMEVYGAEESEVRRLGGVMGAAAPPQGLLEPLWFASSPRECWAMQQ